MDGKDGLGPDEAYPNALVGGAVDLSYYKPREAYALKEAIRSEKYDGDSSIGRCTD